MSKKDEEEEIEKEIKLIEIREAEKAGIIGLKVRDVANAVIKDNELLSLDALLKSIPEELLDTEITDSSLHDVGMEIKKIRDKQREDKIHVRSFLALLFDRIIRL